MGHHMICGLTYSNIPLENIYNKLNKTGMWMTLWRDNNALKGIKPQFNRFETLLNLDFKFQEFGFELIGGIIEIILKNIEVGLVF